MAIKWITVKHNKTGHEHRIPDRKHLLADWAKRGWKPVPETSTAAATTKES